MVNYDESLVPEYRLPDPLVFADGTTVASAADWRDLRRPELLAAFADHVYGRAPAGGRVTSAQTLAVNEHALGGRATLTETALKVAPGEHELRLLLVLPNAAQGPVPVFCAVNLLGNHSVDPDPAITLARGWVPGPRYDNVHAGGWGVGVENNRATDAARGSDAGRWPLPTIIDRGYGFATWHTSDLAPDSIDHYETGILSERDPHGGSLASWGTIGVWAWGLSRVLDHLLTNPLIDPDRVGVLGHSRTAKTALWAAAQDERFAFVAANESGHAGAALSRRRYGETVATITESFPHWLSARYRAYARREYALPIDQHELLALIAPRPLYVAAADADLWTDPRGQFLSAVAATPVYRVHGVEGLPDSPFPAVHAPINGRVSFHLRAGGHDLTAYDWARYLDFADRWVRDAPAAPVTPRIPSSSPGRFDDPANNEIG